MRRLATKPTSRRAGRFSRLSFAERHDTIATFWKINGYPAQILIWTEEEWARLAIRPADARHHPSGVWCALRMQ